jgi:hypothetical protein
MYRLAYVEGIRPDPLGLVIDEARAARFRIEDFPSSEAAVARAREFLDMAMVSAVELFSVSGEIVFDAHELAGILRIPSLSEPSQDAEAS